MSSRILKAIGTSLSNNTISRNRFVIINQCNKSTSISYDTTSTHTGRLLSLSSTSSLYSSSSSSSSNLSQLENTTTTSNASSTPSSIGYNVSGTTLQYKKILIVIKQTAFEEYSQLKLGGQAPKALRWKRLESRYIAHKQCVTNLLEIIQGIDNIEFSCINRVELDRQHLSDIDLVIAVGGDGTVLSAAHFLDHGTIPLLGINSDPDVSFENNDVNYIVNSIKKQSDERRSHGALCMCTAYDMQHLLLEALYGNGYVVPLTRIRCKVKSTFSETRLVPILNDILIANPSPAAVSRFRMGWLKKAFEQEQEQEQHEIQSESNDNNIQTTTTSPSESKIEPVTKNMYGSITRFDGVPYNVTDSMNVWSSGMWVSTATGSTAAMKAAGGHVMTYNEPTLQYLIREHMIEQKYWKTIQDDAYKNNISISENDLNNGYIQTGDKLHIRWNSQHGRIFIDGSHLIHQLELGDEILIDNNAPALKMFRRR